MQGRGHMSKQPVGSRLEVFWQTSGISAFFTNSARQQRNAEQNQNLCLVEFFMCLFTIQLDAKMLLYFKNVYSTVGSKKTAINETVNIMHKIQNDTFFEYCTFF